MNRVIAHTGARYPIVQAPMGWIARSTLASAVSRAGGLGIIETSSGETEACQREIRAMVANVNPEATVVVSPTPAAGLAQARSEAGAADRIVVFGSFLTVADVQRSLATAGPTGHAAST